MWAGRLSNIHFRGGVSHECAWAGPLAERTRMEDDTGREEGTSEGEHFSKDVARVVLTSSKWTIA